MRAPDSLLVGLRQGLSITFSVSTPGVYFENASRLPPRCHEWIPRQPRNTPGGCSVAPQQGPQPPRGHAFPPTSRATHHAGKYGALPVSNVKVPNPLPPHGDMNALLHSLALAAPQLKHPIATRISRFSNIIHVLRM